MLLEDVNFGDMGADLSKYKLFFNLSLLVVLAVISPSMDLYKRLARSSRVSHSILPRAADDLSYVVRWVALSICLSIQSTSIA